jgi:hypothetical protein
MSLAQGAPTPLECDPITGTKEVNKVAAVVAALQDVADVKAMAHEKSISDASERRAAELEKVSAKGALQGQKVKQAAAKMQAEADELAQQLRASPHHHIASLQEVWPVWLMCALIFVGAMQDAADLRRAAKVGSVAAKGTAEIDKVKRSADALKQEMEMRAEILHQKLERAEG